jgi:hypothetical protein
MWSLWFIACTPETEVTPVVDDPVVDPPVESDDDGDPSPYVVDDTDEITQPALTAAEVSDAVEAAIDALLMIDPNHLANAYEDIWALRDDGDCPYYYPEYLELYNLYIWSDSCTSAAGAGFEGYGYYSAYHDYVGSYYTYDRSFYVYAQPVEMTAQDGQKLVGSGTAYMYDIDYWAYGYRATATQLQGAWRWEGARYADSWLGAGVSIDISLYTTQYDNGGATHTSVTGSLADISDTITAVNFDAVYLMNAAAYTACDLEPGGSIRVRDEEGSWYSVTFDGPAYSGAPSFPATCDGCADVWWRGEHIGEACPDTSALVRWEDRPWR